MFWNLIMNFCLKTDLNLEKWKEGLNFRLCTNISEPSYSFLDFPSFLPFLEKERNTPKLLCFLKPEPWMDIKTFITTVLLLSEAVFPAGPFVVEVWWALHWVNRHLESRLCVSPTFGKACHSAKLPNHLAYSQMLRAGWGAPDWSPASGKHSSWTPEPPGALR